MEDMIGHSTNQPEKNIIRLLESLKPKKKKNSSIIHA